MRGATPKDHKALLKRIEAHLRLTREGPYSFSQRVVGDKTFLWKLKNRKRMPFDSTIKKIDLAIRRDLAAMRRSLARRTGPSHGH